MRQPPRDRSAARNLRVAARFQTGRKESPMTPSYTRAAAPILAASTVVGISVLMLRRAQDRGHPPDSAPGRTARRDRFGRYVVTGCTVTIAAPPDAVYCAWCDFGHLASFMENVRAVEHGEGDTWVWTIAGPGGTSARAITRVVENRPGQAISWRSVKGSPIDTEGKIAFRPAPGGRGTEVSAIVAYRPPGGALGHWIAKVFRRDPRAQGRHELKRLKMLMETGEIATAAMRPEDREGN
jgi:uncharacterized membrane protein